MGKSAARMDWIDPQEATDRLQSGQGTGVRIAVLDSGVEIGHSDFADRRLVDDVIVQPDSNEILPGTGEDPLGHGTAVASLIWKTAPAAEIGSFRVLRNDLKGRSSQIAAAAREAMARNYQILNCSFGCCVSGHLLFYKDWVDAAYQANVHIVAASSGVGHPEWPAQLASVLSVECAPAGSATRFYHRSNSIVEFAIPALDCPVAWTANSHRNLTGSSFAAAIFTGLIARIVEFYPHIQPLQLKVLMAHLAGRAAPAIPLPKRRAAQRKL